MTIKSINATSITVTHDDGSSAVYAIATATVKVTLNGKVAKVADLKPGDRVELSGDPATFIAATR